MCFCFCDGIPNSRNSARRPILSCCYSSNACQIFCVKRASTTVKIDEVTWLINQLRSLVRRMVRPDHNDVIQKPHRSSCKAQEICYMSNFVPDRLPDSTWFATAVSIWGCYSSNKFLAGLGTPPSYRFDLWLLIIRNPKVETICFLLGMHCHYNINEYLCPSG